MKKITLGFSPCPNDTFIFEALVNGKIATKGLAFEVVMEDVEALNKMSFEGKLDVTKLSYHALAHLLPTYQLLDSGSALGTNCGPLLITKREMSNAEIEKAKIAIPGTYTTANFLLNLAFPKAQNKVNLLFSEIEEAVESGKVDLGLIIHENRFTYQEKGLVKVMDLGEFWEKKTQLPIPLGGITVKRTLDWETKWTIQNLIKESVQLALATPKNTLPFVKKYAQAMDEKVMMQHIGLYVNDYTISLGKVGQKAVNQLFRMAYEKQLLKPFEGAIFVQKKENEKIIS